MAGNRIDYKGFRWRFFAEIAAESNPDLRDAFEAESWSKKDRSWMSIRDAMLSSNRLDPVVLALSDLQGESFEATRRVVLSRLENMAKQRIRFSMISAPYCLSFLHEVDPMLYSWFFVCMQIVEGSSGEEIVSKTDQEQSARISDATGYARLIAATFTMRQDAALRELKSIVSDASAKFERYFGASVPERSVRSWVPFITASDLAALCSAMITGSATRQDASRLASMIFGVRPTSTRERLQVLLKTAEEIAAYPPTPTEDSGLLGSPRLPIGVFAAGVIAGAAVKRLL